MRRKDAETDETKMRRSKQRLETLFCSQLYSHSSSTVRFVNPYSTLLCVVSHDVCFNRPQHRRFKLDLLEVSCSARHGHGLG